MAGLGLMAECETAPPFVCGCVLCVFGRMPFRVSGHFKILAKSPLDLWPCDGTNTPSTSFAKLPLVDNAADHDDES